MSLIKMPFLPSPGCWIPPLRLALCVTHSSSMCGGCGGGSGVAISLQVLAPMMEDFNEEDRGCQEQAEDPT